MPPKKSRYLLLPRPRGAAFRRGLPPGAAGSSWSLRAKGIFVFGDDFFAARTTGEMGRRNELLQVWSRMSPRIFDRMFQCTTWC